MFPLPAATNSEFRWLNVLSGEYAADLDATGYVSNNRYSTAIPLTCSAPHKAQQDVYISPTELSSCQIEFLGLKEQKWTNAHPSALITSANMV